MSVLRYASALSRLDDAEQRAAFAALGLTKEQQKLVISAINASAATSDLTISQAEEMLGMTKGRLAKKLSRKATDELTMSIINQAIAENAITEKDSKLLLALSKRIAANKALGESYDELTLKEKLAATAAAMTPMGWVTLALSVLPIVIASVSKLYDLFTVTAEEARENADNLRSTFEETKSELEGLNSELETSRERLKELQELSDAGTITLVEQEELDNLKAEINLLERRKAILDEQAKNEAIKADEALVEAFNKQRFKSPEREIYTAERDSLKEQFDALVREGDIDAANELHNRIGQLNDILASGYDYATGTYLDEELGPDEYIHKLINAYNDADPASELYKSIREKLVGVASIIQTDYIDDVGVDEETRASWQALFDEIDRTINRAEHFTRALDSLPTGAKDKLEAYGKAGDLTAEKVNELAEAFPELKSWMDESTYTAEEVAANFNALSISSESAAVAVEKATATFTQTVETLNTASGNIESISKALGEFKEEGSTSIGTLSGMSDELKNLSSYENFVNVLSDSSSAMKDVQTACNQLAKEYIDTTGILDDINESNAKLIETQLEEMGVLNAHEIVQAKLNAAKYKGVIAEASFSDATENGAEALLKKAGASETVIESLRRLRQEEYNAALATQDLISASTNSINALISQAKAAGVAAESVAGLGKALKLKEDYANGKLHMTLSEYREYMDTYSRQAKADISGISVTVPTVKVSAPKSSSSKSGSSKEVEAYIADIDKYREATERLRKAQEEKDQLDRRINDSEDMRERILLERQLINAYENESSAVKTLNKLRSETINSNAESLRKLGFEVQYNADTNELWISNLEHLNKLTASSKGKYGSLQEATNALRKDTEELIEATTSLNEENRDGADSIYELGTSVHDTKSQIVDDLKEIVSRASEAVDEIQNVYDTLKSAAEEYEANGGFISIDTFQSILDLGPQYMQYLQEENDLLVINEEHINRVIEAKTRQLAAEQALTYVERVKAALQDGSIENLNTLLYATTDATEATFGLAYAELELMHQMGDLDDVQYSAAMHNIDAIRSLCETAVGSIGKVSGAAEKAVEESKKQLESLKDELEDMQDAGDDIIKYVMDMLKHRIQQQIDALEEMKDKYSEIIELKKESLRASKEEEDYQKKIKSKLREMAKLQEKIDTLGLDDSRSAQAERSKLLENMAELQDELNDTQADKAIEVAEDALDKMEEAYHQEKDNEIKILEDSISSYQKLWSKAIEYIRSNYSTLLAELTDWNTNYGQVLNSEITDCWAKCQSAAQRYGDFVSAMMGGIKNEIASINAEIERMSSISSSGSSGDRGSANIVGNIDSNRPTTDNDRAAAIIKQMYANMNEHGGAGSSTSAERKAQLSQKNLDLGEQLHRYGIMAYRSTDKEDYGTWYTDSTKREKLFDKYRRYIFHTGGVVGGGTLKDDEQLTILKKKEWVLSNPMIETVCTMIDHMKKMSKALSGDHSFSTKHIVPEFIRPNNSTVNNISNSNRPVEINFGDTIINGASPDSVKQHEVLTRQMKNEIGKWLLNR